LLGEIFRAPNYSSGFESDSFVVWMGMESDGVTGHGSVVSGYVGRLSLEAM
jgi:hypothetical protein